jgi:hypothetical protein
MNRQWLYRPVRLAEIRSWLLQRNPVDWHHYLHAAVMAYALPWFAVLTEMALTWRHQMHLAMHFGFPRFTDPSVWLWMTVPAGISFLILAPVVRYPVLRRIFVVCISLGWMAFLFLNEAETK